MIYMGIDVGLNGAIAVLSNYQKQIYYRKMPIKRSRNDYNIVLIDDVLNLHTCDCEEETLIIIEKLHPLPNKKRGSISAWKLSRGLAIVETLCIVRNLPCELISPQAWKRHFGLIKKGKMASIDKVKELYPDLDIGKDHNVADAILIARYGMEKDSSQGNGER